MNYNNKYHSSGGHPKSCPAHEVTPGQLEQAPSPEEAAIIDHWSGKAFKFLPCNYRLA